MSPQERGRLGALARWREKREGKLEEVSSQLVEWDIVNEAGRRISQELGIVERPESKGIERELRVIGVGPNPRMVRCEYWELESRRTCVVNVRNNRKWLKGMRLVMEEPSGEEAFLNPWEYEGKQPRRKGRW